MRRLELLEEQLNEERMKRRETERRVLELLEQSKGAGGGGGGGGGVSLRLAPQPGDATDVPY